MYGFADVCELIVEQSAEFKSSVRKHEVRQATGVFLKQFCTLARISRCFTRFISSTLQRLFVSQFFPSFFALCFSELVNQSPPSPFVPRAVM
jgi:hypothetical protein